jgi:tetratricopeptide (TPR) repeat protein
MHRIAVLAVLLVCGGICSTAVSADDYQEATKLYKLGGRAEALDRLNAFLSEHPRDARARFLKGVILTEQNKPADAIKVFTALTQDYPELPEPYNNLAVLYAAQGEYDKARQALEMSIRTHPSYAVAHENLGDIYATLASQAYDKALQLDSANTTARTKLALIRELFPAKTALAAATGKTEPVKPAEPSKPVVEAPKTADPPKPGGATKMNEGVKGGEADAAAAPVVTAEASKESAERAKPAVASPQQDQTKAVLKMVEDWTKAWSNNDADGYLSFYAPDFQIPGSETRAQWEAARRDRLAKPRKISVKAVSPKVTLTDASHATVSFRQSYSSNSLKTSGRKTLQLVKEGERWLIQQESVDK